MHFNKVLNEVRISKFVELYKKDDKRIQDRSMVRNLTDEAGKPLSFVDARHELRKRGVTISPQLEDLLRDLTSEVKAKEDLAKAETERKKELRGKMKGGVIAKSRGYI